MAENNNTSGASSPEPEEEHVFYRIRFRKEGQEFTAESQLKNLVQIESVPRP